MRPRHCEEQSDEAIQSPSFRDGPKDQTSDVQLHIGDLEIPGSMLRIAPGMTASIALRLSVGSQMACTTNPVDLINHMVESAPAVTVDWELPALV
jgi:hypothetical protein